MSQFWYDFGADTVGTTPSIFTEEEDATAGQALVVADATAPSGKVLRLSSTGGSGADNYYNVVRNDLPAQLDWEAATVWQYLAGFAIALQPLYLRAQLSSSAAAYFFNITSGGARSIFRQTGLSSGAPNGADLGAAVAGAAPAFSTRRGARARVVTVAGVPTLSVKDWLWDTTDPPGTPVVTVGGVTDSSAQVSGDAFVPSDFGEPAGWTVQRTDGSPLAAGRVGLGALFWPAGNPTRRFDYDFLSITDSPATESAQLRATLVGAHNASQFQVLRVSDNAVIYDSGTVAASVGPHTATGLAAATGYYARVRYRDAAYNVWSAWGVSANFTTHSPPNTPVVTTSAITQNGVTLTGSAYSDPDGDAHASSQFRVVRTVGGAVDYDSGEVGASVGPRVVGGLSTATSYTGQIRYKDNLGSWSGWGISAAFNTPDTPVVTTAPASAIGAHTAHLAGTVNPNGLATDAWFEYSLDPTFATYASTAHQAKGSGMAAVAVVADITALRQAADYYYRTAASNALGTSRSAGVAFSTLLSAQYLLVTEREKHFQIRIAYPGSTDVEGSVDFSIPGSYLAEEPTLTGPTLRPQDGRTETQPIDLKIIETDPVITANLATLSGRLNTLGRLADIQESPDGVTWVTVATGRISSLSQTEGPGLWHLQIDDERWIERQTDIFTTADTMRVWPAGLASQWRFIPGPPHDKPWFRVGPSAGHGRRVVVSYDAFGEPKGKFSETDPIPPGGFEFRLTKMRAYTGLIKLLTSKENFYYPAPLVSSTISYIQQDQVEEPDAGRLDGKGNFEHLRLRLGDYDYEIISFGQHGAGSTTEALVPNDGTSGDAEAVDVWIVEPIDHLIPVSVDPLILGSPSVPQTFPIIELPGPWIYGYIYNATPAPVSESNPLHVGIAPWVPGIPYAPVTWEYGGTSGFIHPFLLVKKIWDAIGVRYDASTISAYIADTQYSPVAYRITSKASASNWLEDNIFKVYGVLPVPLANGRLTLIKVRLPDWVDVDTLAILNESNCSTYPTWNNTSNEVANVITFTWIAVQRAAKRRTFSGGFPSSNVHVDDTLTDAPADLVDVKERSQVENDDNVAELGYHPIEIPLLGTPTEAESKDYFISRLGGDVLNIGAPLQPTIKKITQEVFGRFGDGPLRGMVQGLPSTESIALGELVVLDFPSWPNPHLNDLGGQRIVQVLHIEQMIAGPTFEFLDVGPQLQPLDEPTFTLQLDPDVPGRVVVLVTSVPVATDAILELGFGTVLAHPSSWLMKYTGIYAGQVIVRDGLPANQWVWGRARSVKKGRVSSLWNYHSIQITSTPAVLAASIAFDDTEPSILWDLTPSTTHVRIFYDVYPLADQPTTVLTSYLDVAATDDFYILTTVPVANGEALLVALEPWDGVPDDPGSIKGPLFSLLPALHLVEDLPEPQIRFVQLNTTETSTDVQVFFTVGGGRSAQGYYTLGTTFPALPNLASGDIITIPRDTNILEDHLLQVKVVPSSGPTAYATYLVDWNLIPGFSYTNTPVPIFDVDQVLIGWRLVGAVDDDARGLRWTLPAGLSVLNASTGAMVGGYWWMDVSVTKSYWIEVLEDPGITAEIQALPTELYDTGAPGILGAPYHQILRRPPQSKLEVRPLSHTTRSLLFTMRPAGVALKYRINGDTWTTIALAPTETVVLVSPVVLPGGTALVEWQSFTGTNIEEIQALSIDVDTQPEVQSLRLFEDPAGYLHVVVVLDDDITRWSIWARKNGSVLVDGHPDNLWLRGDYSRQKGTYDSRAGVGPWEVVVRGYDDHGQYSEKTASIYIRGEVTTGATISNLRVAVEDSGGGVFKQRLRWDHNAAVEAGGYYVDVYRNGVKQTLSPWDARFEYGGANTVPNQGSWQEDVQPADAGTNGAAYRTYNYRAELRRSSDDALVSQGTASISRYYMGITPGGPTFTTTPAVQPGVPEVLNVAGFSPDPPDTGVPDFGTGAMRAHWTNTSEIWNVRCEFSFSTTLGGAKTVMATQDLDPNTSFADIDGYTSGQYAWARLQYYNTHGDGPWTDYSAGAVVD